MYTIMSVRWFWKDVVGWLAIKCPRIRHRLNDVIKESTFDEHLVGMCFRG